MREIPPGLRELRGAPLAILYALKWAAMPVEQNWLMDATGYNDSKTIKKSMRLLRRLGLATYRGETYCTDCQLTGPANQLPLGFDTLLNAQGAGLAEPTPTDDAAGLDPDPLQAGVPLEPGDQPSVNSRKNSDSSLLVVVKESNHLIDSFNNNNTDKSRKNSDSSARREAAHVADVAAALLRKGLPRLADDDLFPPELRLAIERMVVVGRVGRRRAEQAVAHSPWPADKILEQVAIWAAYGRSSYGANLKPGMFPFLIAARIEAGDECPHDTRTSEGEALGRYDGYLEHNDPQADDPQDDPQEDDPQEQEQ